MDVPSVSPPPRVDGAIVPAGRPPDRLTGPTVAAFLLLFAVWCLMRFGFAVGYAGSDDLHHIRFAASWDRAPANHWESRLLANAIIGASFHALGRSEFGALLPAAIASLVTGVLVVGVAWRWLGAGPALIAASLLAVLPIDVESATSVSAFPPMFACLTAGTILLLEHPDEGRRRWAGAALVAVAVLFHYGALVYAAGLVIGGWLALRRRWFWPAGAIICAIGVALALEATVFLTAYSDPTLGFRAAAAQQSSENPDVPLFINASINPAFLAWPIAQGLYSKAFGPLLVIAVAMIVVQRRTLPRPLLAVVIVACVQWLWTSYGSQVPWEYKPFWRMTRFWLPVAPAAVLVCAAGYRKYPRRAVVACGVVAVCSVVNLAASGPWGQSVAASRELLARAETAEASRFVVDRHTANEMFVLNGCQPVARLCTTEGAEPWKLFDRDIPRLGLSDLRSGDVLLVNPINLQCEPAFRRWVSDFDHRSLWVGESELRSIVRVVPWLRESSWAVRRPPSSMLAWSADVDTTGG